MFHFYFSKEYILENDFVKLSPLKIQHVEELAGISDEPSIWTYFLEKGKGKENLFHYIQAALQNRKNGKEYPFVVFDKIKNAYAGITRLYEFNQDLKIIKLGHTWYGTNFQGTGLNKNCKYLLFEFAFEKLDVERIGFGVHGENLRSKKALLSVGCQHEGALRNFLNEVAGEKRVDLDLFSILKKEWFGHAKKALRKKLT